MQVLSEYKVAIMDDASDRQVMMRRNNKKKL